MSDARKKIIQIPSGTEIADLRGGDIIYISGLLATGRDSAHRRCIDEKIPFPADLRNGALFHAGPIARENSGTYELVSIGPTSSIRMEKWAADFIKETGLKIMIGKGGMGAQTAAACREYGAIHCVYPGGCAVLGARQVLAAENVYWRDLGMPEAVWLVRVHEFGPLIVSIDTRGNNLFAENARHYASQAETIIQEFWDTGPSAIPR